MILGTARLLITAPYLEDPLYLVTNLQLIIDAWVPRHRSYWTIYLQVIVVFTVLADTTYVSRYWYSILNEGYLTVCDQWNPNPVSKAAVILEFAFSENERTQI